MLQQSVQKTHTHSSPSQETDDRWLYLGPFTTIHTATWVHFSPDYLYRCLRTFHSQSSWAALREDDEKCPHAGKQSCSESKQDLFPSDAGRWVNNRDWALQGRTGNKVQLRHPEQTVSVITAASRMLSGTDISNCWFKTFGAFSLWTFHFFGLLPV